MLNQRHSKLIFSIILVGLLAFLAWFSYWKLATSGYISFSDAAKFGQIAKNTLSGKGYLTTHFFFNQNLLFNYIPVALPQARVLPVIPLAIIPFLIFFGTTDLAIIASSGFFFILLAVAVFLLGTVVFGSRLIGFLASLAVIFNPNFLDYATSGASEPLFAFEITLGATLFYLAAKKNQKLVILAILVMVAAFLTRHQAFIYLIGFWLFFIYSRAKNWRIFAKSLAATAIVGVVLDRLLAPFTGRSVLYSPFASVSNLFYGSPFYPEGNTLRSRIEPVPWNLATAKILASKTFYNLYNFFKRLPSLGIPYLIGLYILSLLHWEREKVVRYFRLTVALILFVLFLAASLTIPNLRYVHPVLPLLAIFAAEMLIVILASLRLPKKLVPWLATGFIIIFVAGPTLGEIFVDYRFRRNTLNLGKPPVYVRLAEIIGEASDGDDLIVTNLDAWAAWYQDRATMWYPIKPEQLVPPEGEETKIDLIFLSSYKMDEGDFYMGPEWRQAMNEPEAIEDPFLGENFELLKKIRIEPEEVYENQGHDGVILERKT